MGLRPEGTDAHPRGWEKLIQKREGKTFLKPLEGAGLNSQSVPRWKIVKEQYN